MNRLNVAFFAGTNMRLLACTGVIVLSAGCGGGGSDEDSENSARLSGTWSGAMTKVVDTCNRIEFPQTFTYTNVVSQNESAIELQDGTGLRYLGNTVGGSGFSVDTATTVTVSGSSCTQARRIEYEGVNDDDDNTAETEFKLSEVCENNATCEVQYSGTASRTSGGQPNPTPTSSSATPAPGTPAPTATPGGVARTGCLAMNPNTASGVYEGNGGCGFSEADFSFNGTQSVILNPLGGNGLTTFNVDAANTSTASSVRTDLTVNGDVGYACSMVCSPPGTFTVTCNREGGTQCVEKF